jgi:hypothetical protein
LHELAILGLYQNRVVDFDQQILYFESLVDGRDVSENHREIIFFLSLLEPVHFEPFSEHLFPVAEEAEHLLSERVEIGPVLEHHKNRLLAFELHQPDVFLFNFVVIDVDQTLRHLFHVDFIPRHLDQKFALFFKRL